MPRDAMVHDGERYWIRPTSRAEALDSGDPRFTGSQLTIFWMITGESRPYLRAPGAPGPITPTSRLGAFDVVVRRPHLA